MEKYIERAESTLLHTYNRYQIVLDKAKDVYLYDINGKQYLDFMSGIGVFALGYGNEELNHVIKEQVDKLTHTSNMFYNVPAIEAAEKELGANGRVLVRASGTEPLVRVMIEGRDKEQIENLATMIADIVEERLI